MSIGHFMKGQLMKLGMITVCVATDEGGVAGTSVDPPTGSGEHPSAAAETESDYTNFIKKIKATSVPVALRKHVVVDDNNLFDRTIVEFCCEDTSLMGMRTAHSKGCRVIRITKDVDGRSDLGVYLSAKGCTSRRALLYSSIPCTGGTTWN